jgi:hypothetical protein
MGLWTFYDFRDARGVNVIRHWLDRIPAKSAAKINTRILFMRAIAVWPEQYVSSLKGWPHLVELRVGSFGNQYRPIGFYGPERHQFTIVLVTIEKGKIPKRVLETADENRRIVLADRTRCCEHAFDTTPIDPESRNE